MQVAAKLKYARISPQKCRLVADMVRGQPVGRALATLRFTPKKGAEIVRKVLESAIANAENNNKAKPEKLIVLEALAGTAGSQKRWQPKARGSAGPVLKRRCHIKIVLTDGSDE